MVECNDYSVFECWGFGKNGCIYLLDFVCGKWEVLELCCCVLDFWNKYFVWVGLGNLVFVKMCVEDKVSGMGLIQDIWVDGGILIEGIECDKDKLMCVMDIVSYIEFGLVYVFELVLWVSDFLFECDVFMLDDMYVYDDQIDLMVDVINDLFGSGWVICFWERLVG